MELGFLLRLTLGEEMPGAGLAGVVVVGTRHVGQLVSQEEISQRSDNLSGATGAESPMGQW